MIDVPVLRGDAVRLEVMTADHIDGLVAAASESRATYDFTTVPDGPDETKLYVLDALAVAAAGQTVPFVQVRVADDTVVGVTRFLSLRYRDGDDHPYAVEIGGTWLAASAQRTGINTEAKLLLLDYAFDVWGVGRVDFKTDARNDRSRTAIARLGATFEGVLRNWQPSHALGEDGFLRDTAMFAIVAEDWPAVRAQLVSRLG